MLADKKIIGLVPITDAARAKVFYTEKLGLKFVSEDPFALVFDAHGNMLRLTKMKEFTPQRFSILSLCTSDAINIRSRITLKLFEWASTISRSSSPLSDRAG